ncbi:MAG TPA: HD domain-containing phosphohydrolase [Elusimicrobiota bacterium]|nr:HD domain-containing phosphohydrolase [Elusimicrobiota bacterium]
MPISLLIAGSVFLILAAALAWALTRISTLKKSQSWTAPEPDSEKLDLLLSSLLSLQQKGISRSGTVSKEDFGQAVLENACALMGCERGTIMLWDEKEGCLKTVAAKNPAREWTKALSLKPGEGVAGKSFVTGQPIFIEDPKNDPRYVKGTADSEPFLSMPLLVKSKPVGVLNLNSREGHRPFSDYNVKFLTLLAGEAAVMLHNIDLFDSLETFYLEMVRTLARAVDSKDAYTHEHSERASNIARRLAQELGLPTPMVRYVEYAALLHDIGKIGIDEAILLKPGKLTAEEYEIMKKHPMIGHQILSPVKFLGPVAQMVLHHQEWYNGQGYPEGLKGEDIPLGARIVAIIDAWDAMTSDRPYRKALPREVAVGELKRGAGTQFDPKIVEIFLSLEAEAPSQGATNSATAR